MIVIRVGSELGTEIPASGKNEVQTRLGQEKGSLTRSESSGKNKDRVNARLVPARVFWIKIGPCNLYTLNKTWRIPPIHFGTYNFKYGMLLYSCNILKINHFSCVLNIKYTRSIEPLTMKIWKVIVTKHSNLTEKKNSLIITVYH